MDTCATPGNVTQREENTRVGSRRDRQIHELRTQLQELNDFVDVMARELSALRRHVQFHTLSQPAAGCPGCFPTTTERETDQALRLEASANQRDVA